MTNKKTSFLTQIIAGFISIGKSMTSFSIFPEQKTSEEMRAELTAQYKHLGIDFTKDDRTTLSHDMRMIGNDMRHVMNNLK